MQYLQASAQGLRLEDVALTDIAAEFGTPCYVYSARQLREALQSYQQHLGPDDLVCYAMKANSNLSLLRLFASMGAGFDIVSGGELARVLAAGGEASKVVFSGVGKSEAEIRQALAAGIRCFNVESVPELNRINAVATAMQCRAPISLRVNPNVDAQTHPYISTGLKENKFGIPYEQALATYQHAASLPHLDVVGIDCHIGSQLTELAPFLDALDKVLELITALQQQGIHLHHLDLGGGLGIRYQDETPPAVGDYIASLRQRMASTGLQLILEPGRSLVGNAGLLLTRVEYLKTTPDRQFAIVDAAMNDLMRPALYEAWHDMQVVQPTPAPAQTWDVVGPVCESGDFLAKNRRLALDETSLLAVLSAGAYGMSMSSNYNSRPRAAEVLVDGAQAQLIRARETMDDLLRAERACL